MFIPAEVMFTVDKQHVFEEDFNFKQKQTLSNQRANNVFVNGLILHN